MDSLIQAILEATLLSKAVLLLLLFMSVMSWGYMVRKWLQLQSYLKCSAKDINRFYDADNLSEGLMVLASSQQSSFAHIAERGIREFNRINRTGDGERLITENVQRAMRFGISEEMARLSSSLSLLATTCNTAPFIGLFGTVWGIMHSFQSIALMKSVSLATVAPGIAEALIATAVGLFVAIPATLGYNVFRSKLSEVQAQNVSFAGLMLNRLQHEVNMHSDGIDFCVCYKSISDMREDPRTLSRIKSTAA